MTSEVLEVEGSKAPKARGHEPGSSDFSAHLQEYQFHSTSALEILRETVRILRYNCSGFMAITAFFVCHVSAVFLTGVLVDHSVVKRLTTSLLFIARASGLLLNPALDLTCQRGSEMAVSTAMCFPLYMTLLLLSKTAIVYSVYCTYSKKQFDAFKFYEIVRKLWKRVGYTYVWACMVIVGMFTLFLVLLVAICYMFLVSGFSPDLILYPGVIVGLFSQLSLRMPSLSAM